MQMMHNVLKMCKRFHDFQLKTFQNLSDSDQNSALSFQHACFIGSWKLVLGEGPRGAEKFTFASGQLHIS